MNIKIKLEHAFRSFAGNREIINVKGTNVKECIDILVNSDPIFKGILYDVDGALATLVLLNSELIVLDDINRPITERSELFLLHMIQGG
jgi:hypothetical protein